MTSIRSGSRRVAFGDVVDLSKERASDPDADGFERYVGLEHLDPGDLRISHWGDVTDGTTFTNVFHSGQVLFGKRRAYQRKVAVADFAGVCSGDIYVLETKDPLTLLPELLPFICQTEAFFSHAVDTSAGSLSPRTNWASLATFEFELPPMEEQRRITDLLTASSNYVVGLNRIFSRSEELRNSLARALFEQAFSDERSIRLGDAISDSAFGPRFSSALYAQDGLVRIIRTSDFRDDSSIDYESPPRADLRPEMVAKHKLVDGDFLLSRSGEYAGMTRVFREVSAHGRDYIPAAYLIRFRLMQEVIEPLFLHEYCESAPGQRAIRMLTQGSAQPNISGESFLNLRIPAPTLNDQVRICQLIGGVREAAAAAAARETRARHIMSALIQTCITTEQV